MEKTVQHKPRTLSFLFLVVAILAVGAFYHQMSLSGKVVDRSGERVTNQQIVQNEEEPTSDQNSFFQSSSLVPQESSLEQTSEGVDYYDFSSGPLGASLSGFCNEPLQAKCPDKHTLTCEFSYDVEGDLGKCKILQPFVDNLCDFLKDQAEQKAKDYAQQCSKLTVSVPLPGGKVKIVPCAGDTGSATGSGGCYDKLNPAPGKNRNDYINGDGKSFATIFCKKTIELSCNFASAYQVD